MNSSELAQKMLEWEQAQTKADALALEIREAVLELGKTQTVGNVRATYSNGRKSYDYETGAVEHPAFTHEFAQQYSKTSIDWRSVCKALNADAPFTESTPSVTIKLVG